jgi:hypothetical protein
MKMTTSRDDRDVDSDDDISMPVPLSTAGRSPVPTAVILPLSVTDNSVEVSSGTTTAVSAAVHALNNGEGSSPSTVVSALTLAASVSTAGATASSKPSTADNDGEDGDRVTASNTMFNRLHGVTGGGATVIPSSKGNTNSETTSSSATSGMLLSSATSLGRPGMNKDLHLEIASLANSISQVNPTRTIAASGRHSSLRSSSVAMVSGSAANANVTSASLSNNKRAASSVSNYHYQGNALISSSVVAMMTVMEDEDDNEGHEGGDSLDHQNEDGVDGGVGNDDPEALQQQQELTEKAMIVIRRVLDKLTGLDFVSNANMNEFSAFASSSSSQMNAHAGHPASPNTSTGSGGSNGVGHIALEVKEQVDRLIHEATSNENLSQSFFGWCPFW